MPVRRYIALTVSFLCLLCFGAKAQNDVDMGRDGLFKSNAFTQSYNDDDPTKTKKDTADVLFSFPELFGGYAHTRTTRIGTLAAGSAVFVGGMQIYNEQYWKLPIIYGGIGAGVGLGLFYNSRYNQTVKAGMPDNKYHLASVLSFAGAGLCYWGALMDGVACYKPDDYPHVGKATLYSILLPGLGQIYNGEVWKLPLYLGGMATAFSFYHDHRANYLRWRDIYNEASEESYTGPFTAETAKYYRDIYRRYRDYSMLALVAVYLLQIIDANVFAYMHNFEVDDNILTLDISPTVTLPTANYAMNTPSMQAGVGFNLGLKF